jgi:hypothetical protein
MGAGLCTVAHCLRLSIQWPLLPSLHHPPNRHVAAALPAALALLPDRTPVPHARKGAPQPHARATLPRPAHAAGRPRRTHAARQWWVPPPWLARVGELIGTVSAAAAGQRHGRAGTGTARRPTRRARRAHRPDPLATAHESTRGTITCVSAYVPQYRRSASVPSRAKAHQCEYPQYAEYPRWVALRCGGLYVAPIAAERRTVPAQLTRLLRGSCHTGPKPPPHCRVRGPSRACAMPAAAWHWAAGNAQPRLHAACAGGQTIVGGTARAGEAAEAA